MTLRARTLALLSEEGARPWIRFSTLQVLLPIMPKRIMSRLRSTPETIEKKEKKLLRSWVESLRSRLSRQVKRQVLSL